MKPPDTLYCQNPRCGPPMDQGYRILSDTTLRYKLHVYKAYFDALCQKG